ncbi:hypothetical protein LINPERHAP2_LOCUS21174 [Linum perenne]
MNRLLQWSSWMALGRLLNMRVSQYSVLSVERLAMRLKVVLEGNKMLIIMAAQGTRLTHRRWCHQGRRTAMGLGWWWHVNKEVGKNSGLNKLCGVSSKTSKLLSEEIKIELKDRY